MKAVLAALVLAGGLYDAQAQQSEPTVGSGYQMTPLVQRARITLDLNSAYQQSEVSAPRDPGFIIWKPPSLLSRSLLDAPGPDYRRMKEEFIELSK